MRALVVNVGADLNMGGQVVCILLPSDHCSNGTYSLLLLAHCAHTKQVIFENMVII